MAINYRKKYNTLRARALDHFEKTIFPHTVAMWQYPKDRLREGWPLWELYERTKAAEQLGYDVILVAADHALVVKYRKHVPVDFAID